MKIILLRDVPGIGKTGDVKSVSSGFVRNFLLPKKLAILATEEELKKVAARQKKREHHEHMTAKRFDTMMEEVKDTRIFVKVKASPDGTLYAGMHTPDLARALQEQKHVRVTEDIIKLAEPLKKLGEYPVTLELGSKSFQITFCLEQA